MSKEFIVNIKDYKSVYTSTPKRTRSFVLLTDPF